MERLSKSDIWMYIGVGIMCLLILTKIVPSTSIAGLSVIVGIVFFFLTEHQENTEGKESGLRFKTFFKDFKKPAVLPLVFLPIVTAIITIIIGDIIFKGMFTAHVFERTSTLSLEQVLTLIPQTILFAFGEEIAFRGFFLGKLMKKHPFWMCAVSSSILFAAAHIAVGEVGVVVYDVITIFIDSLIYSLIYKKSTNCLISTVAHMLGNISGFVYLLFVL